MLEIRDWEEMSVPAKMLPGVGQHNRYLKLFRAMVPGGWLVLVVAEWGSISPSITFVPDPEHGWTSETRTELEAAEAPA